jgi:hypothetical protein
VDRLPHYFGLHCAASLVDTSSSDKGQCPIVDILIFFYRDSEIAFVLHLKYPTFGNDGMH